MKGICNLGGITLPLAMLYGPFQSFEAMKFELESQTTKRVITYNLPGTQMTLVLIGKDLVLMDCMGLPSKIEVIWVLGTY